MIIGISARQQARQAWHRAALARLSDREGIKRDNTQILTTGSCPYCMHGLYMLRSSTHAPLNYSRSKRSKSISGS